MSALVFGLSAGFMGSILSSYYLGDSFNYQDLDLSDSIYSRTGFVIRDAKKVVVNQDLKVEETVSSLQPLLVSAFKIEDNNDYYVLSEASAYGFILSNDGWVLLSGFKETDIKKIINSYQVISYDKKTYEIDDASFVKISGDGQIVLAHLKGASNLPVKQIVSPSDLKIGSSLIILSPKNKTLISYLSDKERPSLQLKSDLPQTHLILNNEIADDFEGALAFNFNGDFVGFIDGNNDLRSSYSFLPAWRSLIVNKEASFPSLGVLYLDLAKIKLINSDIEKGAWLKSLDEEKSAIIKGGVAEKAGFQEGDIIVRINNQEINSTYDLSELISSYLAEDTIRITYIRDGQYEEVELNLGKIK